MCTNGIFYVTAQNSSSSVQVNVQCIYSITITDLTGEISILRYAGHKKLELRTVSASLTGYTKHSVGNLHLLLVGTVNTSMVSFGIPERESYPAFRCLIAIVGRN